MTDPIKGTDISAMQGAAGLSDDVWAKLAAFGIRFAILRLLVGNESWSDIATVRANVARARAHGIAVSPYLFPYPLPHLKPEDQIDRFAKLAEGLGSSAGDIPWMLDAEWPPREEYKIIDGVKTLTYPWKKWGCTDTQIKDWLLAALARGKQVMGVDGLFYSFRYWLQCINAPATPELADYKLVLADYTYKSIWMSRAQYDAIKVPAPWDELTVVQFDGDGGLRLPNGGDADFDVCKDEATFQALLDSVGQPQHENIDVDVTVAHIEANALMLEDAIDAYRATRITEEPEAA